MDRPKSRLAPALIVAGALCALLAAYVASYCLSSDTRASARREVYRHFGHSWQRNLYAPAGWIESKATGSIVAIADPHGAYFFGTVVSLPPEPPADAPPAL